MREVTDMAYEVMSLDEQVARGLVRADPRRVEAKHAAATVIRLDDRRRPAFSVFCTTGANGRPRFVPPLLGEYIAHRTPVAAGGGQLYVYVDGVYREGEQAVRLLITELLGNEWNRSRAEETVAWLRARAPHLNESPSPNEINLRNGTLVLKGGKVTLQPHEAKSLSPVQLPVAYDPAATCPRIEEFLARIFPDEALKELVCEIAGYLLVPDNTYQRAFMLHGPGGNGKSRVLGLLTALLGAENISSRQLQDLDDNRFACADLYGKLANICADISARELQSSSKFKAITGGDRISGERKHQPAFDFTPFSRLLFSANEFPSVRDGSKAFYDRWVVLPCNATIRGSKDENSKILDALTTPSELSGFLNLALAGLSRLRANGGRFTVPAASRTAVQRFRVHADSVAGFVDAHPVRRRGWVKRPDLYRKYQEWCAQVGQQSLSARKFYPRFEELVRVQDARRHGHDGYVLLPNSEGA